MSQRPEPFEVRRCHQISPPAQGPPVNRQPAETKFAVWMEQAAVNVDCVVLLAVWLVNQSESARQLGEKAAPCSGLAFLKAQLPCLSAGLLRRLKSDFHPFLEFTRDGIYAPFSLKLAASKISLLLHTLVFSV